MELAPRADRDRFAIYVYTENQWGTIQAEKYGVFLRNAMQDLADCPKSGRIVPNRENTRVFVARWKNARYGHRVFFRETDRSIMVLRVLHTAMKWQEHLRVPACGHVPQMEVMEAGFPPYQLRVTLK